MKMDKKNYKTNLKENTFYQNKSPISINNIDINNQVSFGKKYF